MIILASIFILLGAAFGLIAAIGIVRMPDLFCRMHAATKAGAFGLSLMLIALCTVSGEPRAIVQSVLVILFFYLTAPVAAQMIGRTAIIRSSDKKHSENRR